MRIGWTISRTDVYVSTLTAGTPQVPVMTSDFDNSSSLTSEPFTRYRKSQNGSTDSDRSSSSASIPASVPGPGPVAAADDSADDQVVKKSRRSVTVDTREEFAGALVPVQVRMPADMVKAMKLACIEQECTMSDYVMRLMCTEEVIRPAWVSRRRAG